MKSDGTSKKGKESKRSWLTGLPWLLMLLLLVAALFWFLNREPAAVTIGYSDLQRMLQTADPNVHFKDVRVEATEIRGKIVTNDLVTDGDSAPHRQEQVTAFRTPRVGLERDTAGLVKLLEKSGAVFQGGEEDNLRGFYSLLMSFLFIFVAIFIGFLLFRWILGGSNSPLTFGRSRHKLYAEKDLKTTFTDVAGTDEAVAELREIVDFLKNPERYQALGGRIPKGVLLIGPPGTGKTLLARAVAGEADVPFFSMSGSDFVEMFVGVGASRVRDLFAQAENRAPCLTGDAVVTLSGGRQVTIQEMFDKQMIGVRVPAMTDDFRLEDATVIGITRKPCPELYEITTNTSVIRATGNHLFPVLLEGRLQWRRADELSEGDYVAAPRQVPTMPEVPYASSWLDPEQMQNSWDSDGLEPSYEVQQPTLLAVSDIVSVTIRSVRQVPRVDYVYDLCLDRHHCFIANNLIVHNCMIFIDELDALGKTRGVGALGGHDEREQTLNALLVEMDGFDSNRGVILMAATNRPETLDAALLRPGRFDRTVVVDRPDLAGREAILKVHTRNVRLAEDVDLRRIASMTPGSVGADLANIINEAALLAARRNRTSVSMPDLEEAVERSLMGLERRSRILTDEDKKRVAYHEGGHALVACALPNADPVHKVTIIPRGVGALGYALMRPEEERFLQTRSELEARIKVALGGTIAEELIYHEISNGATSDLEHANNIAKRMVKDFGMSPLGRVSYPEGNHAVYLPGSPIGDGERRYSEETAREIDLEVRKIINSAVEEVRAILGERCEVLKAVARRLIEKEVIDGDELRAMLKELHTPVAQEPETARSRNGPAPLHREGQTIGPAGPEATEM